MMASLANLLLIPVVFTTVAGVLVSPTIYITEQIKNEVLRKLDLNEAPKVSTPISSSVLQMAEELESHSKKYEELIVQAIATDPGHTRSRFLNTEVSWFPAPTEKRLHIHRATLHAYVDLEDMSVEDFGSGIILEICMLDADERVEHHLINKSVNEMVSRYVKVHLDSRKLQHAWWIDETAVGLRIKALVNGRVVVIHPRKSEKKEHPIFMTIQYENKSKRGRRTLNEFESDLCTGVENPGTCCRTAYDINFKEVGLDFVIVPRQFRAYRCEGTCHGVSEGSKSSAALKVQYAFDMTRGIAGKRMFKSNSCCHPKSYEPLHVMYLVPNGTIIREDVPDMIITSCGCY